MRRIFAILSLLAIAAVEGTAPAAAEQSSATELSPGCRRHTTYQTCNADPACMWYGPYCGPKIE